MPNSEKNNLSSLTNYPKEDSTNFKEAFDDLENEIKEQIPDIPTEEKKSTVDKNISDKNSHQDLPNINFDFSSFGSLNTPGQKLPKDSVETGPGAAIKNFLKSIWSILPAVDDIFDKILATLGLRRKPQGMLLRANSLLAKGRYSEAIIFYREILALKPLAITAYDGLGKAYFRMGLVDEANIEFNIAESLERLINNRDDLDAATILAQAMLARKQPKMAVSLIEPILIAHFSGPNNNELLKAMGKVYTTIRANKKAFQVYQAGLDQYPEDYEFYILKGEADIKKGFLANGERLIKWGTLMQRLRKNPKDTNARMSMGELCIKEKRFEEGLKFLRDAALLSPDNSGVRWRLFNLYQQLGDYQHSLKYFLEVVAIEPDNIDLKFKLADFYKKNGKFEEALQEAENIASLVPREPKVFSFMGDVYNDLGQFNEANKMKDLARTLEGGLKKNPDHNETVKFMRYLFNQGDYELANQWLDNGLARWPYHGELVMTKVKLLYDNQLYKEAATMLKKLIKVKPGMAEPHLWMGLCYQRLGDHMAALAEAQMATRIAPKSFTAHKVLGDILKEQNKISQANTAYETAEILRVNNS